MDWQNQRNKKNKKNKRNQDAIVVEVHSKKITQKYIYTEKVYTYSV